MAVATMAPEQTQYQYGRSQSTWHSRPPQHAQAPAEQRLVWATGGRLRDTAADSTSRNTAMLLHLLPMILFLVALGPLAVLIPLIMWQTNRSNPFVADHGKEHINVWITAGIATLLAATIVLIPFIVAWYIVTLISAIRATIAASNGEYFRYPMTLRLLS